MDLERDEMPFWEQPETVERFSGRDPDLRLQAMVAGLDDPGALRVLDLGCAGGRNTVYLAGLGIDVIAVDSSDAMVAETRRRLAEVIGSEHAAGRVRKRRMDDPSFLIDADTLDREMEKHGFSRLTETVTVRVPTDGDGVRVTANGLYARGMTVARVVAANPPD